VSLRVLRGTTSIEVVSKSYFTIVGQETEPSENTFYLGKGFEKKTRGVMGLF